MTMHRVINIIFSGLLLAYSKKQGKPPQPSTLDESVYRSVISNVQGCSWAMTTSSEAAVGIHVYPPSIKELSLYHSLPQTITMANSALGVGLVGKVPKAANWAKTKNSWLLHPEHPRSNKSMCVQLSKEAGEHPAKFYVAERNASATFYTIHGREAIIHESGTIGLKCGYVQLHEGCETMFKFIGKKWYGGCKKNMTKSAVSWNSYFAADATKWTSKMNSSLASCVEPNSTTTPARYSRVFSVAALWDENYHHFISDSLSRLVRHVDFLRANPDIRIHIRNWEQYATEKWKSEEWKPEAGVALRRRLLQVLGIDLSRIVFGTVLADEFILPRATKCNLPTGHAMELRLLTRELQRLAMPSIMPPQHSPESWGLKSRPGPKPRKIILQHRPCDSPAFCKKTWRSWSNATFDSFRTAFVKAFPDHEVIVIRSGDPHWGNCFACEIREYAEAELLVGLHGAGFTNMMFMPPDAAVFEIVGKFDGTMLPVCGYHGPLASVYGIHHFVYYYDWKGNEILDPLAVAQTAKTFLNTLREMGGEEGTKIPMATSESPPSVDSGVTAGQGQGQGRGRGRGRGQGGGQGGAGRGGKGKGRSKGPSKQHRAQSREERVLASAYHR